MIAALQLHSYKKAVIKRALQQKERRDGQRSGSEKRERASGTKNEQTTLYTERSLIKDK
jgi:hypothetical protein